jgi:membrane fusion protein, multidrug efflux system
MHTMIKNNSGSGLIWVLFVVTSLFQGCTTNADTPARPSKRGESGGLVPVTVTKAVQREVPMNIQVVGNVEAYSTVTVKAQVSGELTHAFFHEGDSVRNGEELFTIDSRGYQAQLNQATANLAKDQSLQSQVEANLARDEANAKYAESEAARYASLYQNRLISKEQLEQVRSNADAIAAAVRADRAAIESARATVEATRAAVENAKVQLSYTTIRSPLDGRTGNLDVKQGNIVSPNLALMAITQVQPIYVTFAVPEAQLESVKKSDTVMVTSQDGASPTQAGHVTFIDNIVDSTTGTIRLKATFANPEYKLWPGQFVRVTLRLGTKPDAVTVPNQAVQTGQDGSFVFVVKPDQANPDLNKLTGSVELRPIVPGIRADPDVVIEKGLNSGEIVVTEGQSRLAPGNRIQVGAAAGRIGGPGAGGQKGGGGDRGGRGRQAGGDQP